MSTLTPREIVAELDKFVVGQEQAKRMVAVAVRNRWRRQHLPEELRDEVAPKNIIMMGPTGVGKTEIARRLAKLSGAPFIKVEATKFTEVGYVGRDVESMVRDLMEIGINLVREEENARVRAAAEAAAESRLLDLLLPVIVLIALCIVGLIWTGGMWDAESENYHNFIMSFSDASAGTGLCLGSIIALVFTFVYYWLRGLITFEKSMEAIPNGFIQMISPILILCFAWTLCGLCRDNGLQVGSFVEGVMANTGSLAKFLPAVIFIVACFIGFATGTSWGTIGIMVPLVCAVFDWNDQVTLLSIGLAASCAGGVCGDHLSPISDTTIMASAGAHCFHLNHVATQIPYGVTVAAVSFVSFIIAGLVQQVVVCMIIAIVLMIGTLLVIRAVTAKKHAGVFQEMAAANKALAK